MFYNMFWHLGIKYVILGPIDNKELRAICHQRCFAYLKSVL